MRRLILSVFVLASVTAISQAQRVVVAPAGCGCYQQREQRVAQVGPIVRGAITWSRTPQGREALRRGADVLWEGAKSLQEIRERQAELQRAREIEAARERYLDRVVSRTQRNWQNNTLQNVGPVPDYNSRIRDASDRYKDADARAKDLSRNFLDSIRESSGASQRYGANPTRENLRDWVSAARERTRIGNDYQRAVDDRTRAARDGRDASRGARDVRETIGGRDKPESKSWQDDVREKRDRGAH